MRSPERNPETTEVLSESEQQRALIERRAFLKFLGRGAALGALASVLPGCAQRIYLGPFRDDSRSRAADFSLRTVSPSARDEFILGEGLRWSLLISWDDVINAPGERFGYNNDFIAFLPARSRNPDEGILWVNHEYPISLFVSGYVSGKKTEAEVIREQASVGGSILKVKRNRRGEWAVVANDPLNRRISGRTPLRLIAPRPIAGKTVAIGTLGNCAGGQTPWETILTCEENYQDFYGELDFSQAREGVRVVDPKDGYGWEKFYPYSPAHYGWVVEIDPYTGAGKKLTALGRFAHESATVVKATDGRCVVYSADDKTDECVYKFVASQPGSLEQGVLYVANVEKGQWIPLEWAQQPALRRKFRDQTEVMIRCREAAKLVGGSPLDRPEDIEIDPKTGAIIIALTNNVKRGNYFGSLVRIAEKDSNPLSLEFEFSTFLAGGAVSGFACPDNLAFDPAGNLWITTDMSNTVMNKKGPYQKFANNGLFLVPTAGADAGQAFQVASAPVDAELTGPCFTPDGRTLFLSVQHPGESSRSLQELTSHWPGQAPEIPKPSVVQISGPALDIISKG